MKKSIAIFLLCLTMIACFSLGVLAAAATSNPVDVHPATSSQYASQSPAVVNQHQALTKTNDQKTNALSNNKSQNTSKLAKFKKFFHDKIVPRLQSAWQHVKGLKIWKHNTTTNVAKK